MSKISETGEFECIPRLPGGLANFAFAKQTHSADRMITPSTATMFVTCRNLIFRGGLTIGGKALAATFLGCTLKVGRHGVSPDANI